MTDSSPQRSRLISALKSRLESFGKPRTQVFLILLVAGVCGAACSFGLLHLGLDRMVIRYPVSAGLAYVVFILLLRQWASRLTLHPTWSRQIESSMDAAADPPAELRSQPTGKRDSNGWDWEAWTKDSSFSPLDVMDFLSADDFLGGVLLLLILVLVIVLVGVIATAPVLVAEAVVDVLLITGLWRRFRRSARTETVGGAIRATVWPAVSVILLLAAIGFVLQLIDPAARSIGDLFR